MPPKSPPATPKPPTEPQLEDLNLFDALAKEHGYTNRRRPKTARLRTFLQYLKHKYDKRR